MNAFEYPHEQKTNLFPVYSVDFRPEPGKLTRTSGELMTPTFL
jgi:hypothetical protein